MKGLPGLTRVVSASGLEHVATLARDDDDVTVSAAERHWLYQALVAQVTQSAFVREVSQILGADDAKGADRGQRPTLRAVQFVGAVPHQNELTFIPLGKVEAPRDCVPWSVGAHFALPRIVIAGMSAATEVRASVITLSFWNVKVSWIPHGGISRNPSRGPALDPAEDIRGMKPPAPNAEALGGEQSAQVRAADRLFVAADELGHLECGEESVRQGANARRRSGRERTGRPTLF